MSIEKAVKKLRGDDSLNALLTGIVALKKETESQARELAESGNYRDATRLLDEVSGMRKILLLVNRLVNDNTKGGCHNV